MKTEKLWINGTVQRQGDAEELVREFAQDTGITGRDYQHLSLLTEETLGMAYQLLRDFSGEIWLESAPDGYQIILEAETRENGPAVRQDVPSGFMAKVAEIMNCAFVFDNPDDVPEYIRGGVARQGAGPVWAGRWSLSAYRDHLQQEKENRDAEIALDELEKSIVARLAKEVTVGIQGNRIRLVITGTAK